MRAPERRANRSYTCATSRNVETNLKSEI